MPIYEYQCLACGRRIEVLQRFGDPPPEACAECGGALKKLVSSPAFQFKGSGWYVTDYARAKPEGKGAKAEGESGAGAKSEGDGGGKTEAGAGGGGGGDAGGGDAKPKGEVAAGDKTSGAAKAAGKKD